MEYQFRYHQEKYPKVKCWTYTSYIKNKHYSLIQFFLNIVRYGCQKLVGGRDAKENIAILMTTNMLDNQLIIFAISNQLEDWGYYECDFFNRGKQKNYQFRPSICESGKGANNHRVKFKRLYLSL